MRIAVTYKAENPSDLLIDFEMDEKIEAALGEIGLEFTGRGFDLEKETRDISFERSK